MLEALTRELGPLAGLLTPDRLRALGHSAEIPYPELARRLQALCNRVQSPAQALEQVETLLVGRQDACAFLETLEGVTNPRRVLEHLTADMLDTPLPGGFHELMAAAGHAPAQGATVRLISDLDVQGTPRLFREVRTAGGEGVFQRWDSGTYGWVADPGFRIGGLAPELDPATVARWIEEELQRLPPAATGAESLVPPVRPAAPPVAQTVAPRVGPPRPVVSTLRQVDVGDLTAQQRLRYEQDWQRYKGPIRTRGDYVLARHGYATEQLQRGSVLGRLGETGVIEQLAGHELERVVNARLPAGSANSRAYPTPAGTTGQAPDHLPPGQNTRYLRPDGSISQTATDTPFSARFVGDSKYRELVPTTDQTRGFVHLARLSDERLLVFYVRWRQGFPGPATLTHNPLLGGLELPVHLNQTVIGEGIRDLARAQRVRIRMVSDPLWR